jgi:hypothetical protein
MMSTTDDWYDQYQKKVNEQSKNIKPVKEISQDVLYMKAVASRAFECSDPNKEKFFYVWDTEGKFGFSESLVNQLMEYAYGQGRKSMDQNSIEKGYNLAREEMAKFLGLD